jgi:hypothetical protein
MLMYFASSIQEKSVEDTDEKEYRTQRTRRFRDISIRNHINVEKKKTNFTLKSDLQLVRSLWLGIPLYRPR